MSRIFLAILLLCSTAARAQSGITDTTRTRPDSLSAAIPVGEDDDDEDLEEVVVSTTRSSRTISNLPTRVEIIGAEEVDEKSNMRPANVSMLLHESTGIQVQQTSATSANASIRIQGLDGRYTQLLKDGFPSFGNFASGLSILEIPPLDLKQVEVIKGPASTLYGAGAIAGVVNFVSRTPTMKAAYNAILNQSHIGQSNAGAFAAQRGKRWGYTLLALYNKQLPYDVDRDGFTELPRSEDYTLHPRVFYYPTDHTVFSVGNSFTRGKRTGGDISLIENGPDAAHTYFEENRTTRNVTTLDASHYLKNGDRIGFKSALSIFRRSISVPGYAFEGVSRNLFAEATYGRNRERSNLIAGTNFISDVFEETHRTSPLLRDFTTTTAGLFAQYNYDLYSWMKLEGGLRVDAVKYGNAEFSNTEVIPLPRVSALFILSEKWSSRIGGGLGYKTPTLFTEQTESFQYQGLAPLRDVVSERSAGGTVDVNFRTPIGEDFSFAINQMGFLTRIANPTILIATAGGSSFANVNAPVISRGFETNVKLIYRRDFKLFAGYTFTDARADYLPGDGFLPLLPKNKINLALIYEREDFLKAGFEAYFTDRQRLSNGAETPSFWELGFMVEKPFRRFSVFINFENLTDVRQSRYKRVVSGPDTAPRFDEIWTHTEGFVVNGGVKFRM